MADLGVSTADSLALRFPAVDIDQAVRLGELTTLLSGKSDTTHTHAQLHDALTIGAGNKSLSLSVDGSQVLTGEVIAASGGGILIGDDGVGIDFGTSHTQAAYGDHTHDNDHVAATADPTQSHTISVTVSTDQLIKADLVLKANGGLNSDGGGVFVEVGTTVNTIAAGDHTHANATTMASGMMSAADKVKLNGLSSSTPLISNVDDSSTILLYVTSGILNAAVNYGDGLTETGSALAVDFTAVASFGHTHDNATTSAAGFMSAEDKTKLDAVPSSFINAPTVDAGNKSITASFDEDVVMSAEVRLDTNSALLIGDGGIKVDLGTSNTQAAYGDHTHANDHVAVTANPTQSHTISVTVAAGQLLSADVVLKANGGLTTDANGLFVLTGTTANTIAAGDHTHSNATTSAAGFMSSADKVKLNALGGQAFISNVDDSFSINLYVSSGILTAAVRIGVGLVQGETALEVDFTAVADKNHTHAVVTNSAAGFMSSAMLASLTTVVSQYGTVSAAVIQAQSDISALADNKADITYVDSGLSSRAPLSHHHPITDIDGLSADLDGFAPIGHVGSTSTDPAIGHPLATTEDAGFMDPIDKGRMDCLSTLLQEQAYAARLLPMVRVESPNIGDPYTETTIHCPHHIEARNIQIGGFTGQPYTVRIRVRGALENKTYTGGISMNGGRIRKEDSTHTVTPNDDARNIWKLQVLDSGAGSVNYYLNGVKGSEGELPIVAIDEEFEITVAGKSYVSVVADSYDNLQGINTLIIPEIPPAPAMFAGQFVQIDAVQVIGYCSLDDALVDGNEGGIYIIGSDPRNGIDGHPGTPGNDGQIGNPGSDGGVGPGGLVGGPGPSGGDGIPGVNGESPILDFGQPPIDMTRDFTRLTLMDGGQANGNVYDILVSGDDIFVAGSFTRFGNRDSWGLARLGANGNFRYDFRMSQGFSEPIRHIRKTADGKLLCASTYDGFFNARSPVAGIHRLGIDGKIDSTFTCPALLSTDNVNNPDYILAIDAMPDGKVMVCTPRTLTILNDDGTVYVKKDAFNNQLNYVRAVGAQLLLSSHAFSGDENTAQKFQGIANPRGLKLLNLVDDTAGFSLDTSWALPEKAGEGANSSCGRSLISPNGDYFIVGNALTKYNSPDTSWNSGNQGNLLTKSNLFDDWTAVGSLTTATRTDAADPVTGDMSYTRISDTDGAEQAYTSRAAVIDVGHQNVVASIYVKKVGSAPATFPVFQLEITGDGSPVTTFVYFNPYTGATQLVDVRGGGTPGVLVDNVDANWWRLNITLNNANAGDLATYTIFPAYSDTMGGSSTALTGHVDVCDAQVRYEAWSPIYVDTDETPALPDNSGGNSDHFRGLYKIGIDGEEDTSFNCNISLTSDDGMVIPFAIDPDGKIYIGGPIAAIDGAAVLPWKLYRLNANGSSDTSFQGFDDDVLVARIDGCGNIIVGGKFTSYGSHRYGRLMFMKPDGYPVDQDMPQESPVIRSSTKPNVALHPCLAAKIWQDSSQIPEVLNTWNATIPDWVPVTSQPGVASRLPNVTYAPVDGSVDPANITLTCPGYPVAAIYYTVDGSDPDATSTLYTSPFTLTAGTIVVKAFARLVNFQDSNISTASFVVTSKLPPVQFSPGTGANVPITVTMTVTDYPSATIYYTTDGSDPTTGSAVYSAPISVSSASTVKAYATLATYRDSDISTAEYATVDYGLGQLPDVVFNPPAGSVAVPVMVQMQCPGHPSATIYYTLDGSTPTNASDIYPGGAGVNCTTGTVKAFATQLTWTPSNVSTATYDVPQAAAPVFSPTPDAASSWVQRPTLATNWSAICSSSTAQYVYAVDNGGAIWLSNDYGKSWTGSTLGNKNWVSISCSPDGQFVVACESTGNPAIAGYLYFSSNAGSTWTLRAPPGAPGNYLAWKCVAAYNAGYFASSQYGVVGGTPTGGVYKNSSLILLSVSADKIFCNYDGSKYIGVRTAFPGLFTNASSNTALRDKNITTCAICYDGNLFICAEYTGAVYTSTDGVSFTLRSGSGNRQWAALGLSKTGTTAYAAVEGGNVFKSTDSGVTWAIDSGLPTAAWKSIAVTNTQSRVYLVAQSQNIWAYVPGFVIGDTVRITSATPGVDIYFTIDGTTPDNTTPHYTSPIVIAAAETLKAIAIKTGYDDSDVTSADYA